MPTSFDISLRTYTDDHATRLPSDFGARQDMAGFEPTYRNIVDYIVRITHRIWEGGTPGYESPLEGRDVEYILDTYHPRSRVFDDYGLQIGNEKIVADTHHTTGAFPDIELIADEVVWAGDAEVGFHTSHRTRIRGTNAAPSKYGPATGRGIDVLVIANCVAKDNVIFLEHVLYNTSGMLTQLGLDVGEEAKRLAADPPPGWPRPRQVWDELRRSTAPSRPLHESELVDGFDPDRFARESVTALLTGNGAETRARDLTFEGTTNRQGDLDALLTHAEELRTAFPDLTPQVDEVYWMGNEADGFEIATRWSADVRHTGSEAGGGLLGPATGAPMQLWGLTQQRVTRTNDGWRATDEWMLINEFDLVMQGARAASA